jgi:MEKHLA domain
LNLTFPWIDPQVIQQSQLILNSYHLWLGENLFDRSGDAEHEARALFEAPFPVLSHGFQTDPILNYGNRAALELWEMDWHELTQMPSRQTAESVNQTDRAKLLEEVARKGYTTKGSGVRISQTGKRFYIPQVVLWNLIDESGIYRGQAASFQEYRYLDDRP